LKVKRRRRQDRPESRDAPSGKKPTADDFTPQAVNRAILSDTVQHPATVYPLAGAVVAGLWSAVFGLTPASFFAVLAGGFVGLGSWVYNFFIRGEKLAEKHVQELRAVRAQHEIHEVQNIEDSCRQAGFDEGAKEAAELTAAYQNLRRFLSEQMEGGRSLSAQRFQVLAEDTYQEGVTILRKALNIFQALRDIDAETLRAELEAWEGERSQLGGDASDSEYRVLDQKIEAHVKRISLYRECEKQLKQLIAESNGLETALETAYLEVTDLVGKDAGSMFIRGGAATELERAVNAARSVEDRLRGLGQEDTSDDQEYLEAGEELLSIESIRKLKSIYLETDKEFRNQ